MKGYGVARFVHQPGVDGGEGGRQRRGVRRQAVPEQVQVAGQFGGSVHDAGDLPDHHGPDAVVVKGFEQREGVEAEGAVRADRANVVVGVLVTQAGARPVQGQFTGAPGGGAETRQGLVDHSGIQHLALLMTHPHFRECHDFRITWESRLDHH
ncbi:hypothetical protein [Nonomuraea sp. NPDC050540]|uniref:hypothetical protein n=1 Tax=Nonomuraea sp. NPDC050540 TaxID=3364367 RepID=UPI00378F2A8E